jgi:hypothetical protein
LVALPLIVAIPPWLNIGHIALADPLLSGPTAATTLGSVSIFRALVAANAGSYWPVVVEASSKIKVRSL